MSNTLDMLAVVEESRQAAMQRREAAVDHLAALALKALVEGEDIREVAKLCGFDLDAQPSPETGSPETDEMRGLLSFSMWGTARPQPQNPAQGFAEWLSKATKNLVLEGLGERAKGRD